MLQDFKAFVMRGNVLDMAVGIVIGAAFGKIVSSFVNGILMPPVGMLVGGVDFSDLFINLGDEVFDSLAAATEAGAPVIAYGQFINVVLDFLIVAFAIFVLVRVVASMQKQKEDAPAPATKRDCPECLSEIPIAARRCRHCTASLSEA
jgi:large conductance mechanosensitive channel